MLKRINKLKRFYNLFKKEKQIQTNLTFMIGNTKI